MSQKAEEFKSLEENETVVSESQLQSLVFPVPARARCLPGFFLGLTDESVRTVPRPSTRLSDHLHLPFIYLYPKPSHQNIHDLIKSPCGLLLCMTMTCQWDSLEFCLILTQGRGTSQSHCWEM